MNMKKIEFDWNTPDQWLLGFYKMYGVLQNMETGEVKPMNAFEIGFLFFTIIIYFENEE
jgi:hypothetical protein